MTAREQILIEAGNEVAKRLRCLISNPFFAESLRKWDLAVAAIEERPNDE